MMIRIFSYLTMIVMTLSLIFICGCAKTDLSDKSGDPTCDSSVRNNSGHIEYNEYTVKYITLEECLVNATDIVYAKYTGQTADVTEPAPFAERIECGDIYLLFEPQTQLMGDPIIGKIKLTTINCDVLAVNSTGVVTRFTSNASQYKEGETYLLVLKKYEFENGDVCYSPMRGIIIPTDGSKPQIYNTTLIEWYSDGFEEGDNLEEYIKDFIKNNAE